MAYTEVTKRSYGQRVGSSFKGIGSGLLLIVLGTVLLWWNEGRAVKTAKMLKEGEKAAVHVDNVASVDPENDGKLIHATAMLETSDVLSDPMFSVSSNAIKLSRSVEYYQWVESSHETKKDKIGGGEEITTTYTYEKKWVSSPIDSDSFKDPEYRGLNKVLMTLKNETEVAQNVNFGAYRLPANLIGSVSGSQPLNIDLSIEEQDQLNEQCRKAANGSYFSNYVHQNGNILYLGTDNNAPQIGDVRVSFSNVLPAVVSIVAKVQGDTFTDYVAKNGKSLSMLSMGEHSMEEMFEARKQANKTLMWILRILGTLLVIGGLKNVFAFIPTLAKVIPFLSKIVGAGLNLVTGAIGLAWSFIVIALAWIAYRPLLGIGLIVAAVALVAFLIIKGKNNPEQPAEPSAPAAE